MNIIAFIFARGNSKGLPGKNILNFDGKPLIAWAIEHALAVPAIDRVIVSTDSEEIKNVAISYGAEVPFKRPAELASDESPEWLSWRHALSYVRESTGTIPDVMVSVPATAPLRISSDIENCLALHAKGASDVVITITDANRNPYFNMVKLNSTGDVGLVNPPQSSIARRQDSPIVYDMATVCYVVDPNFVLAHNSIFEGRVKAVHIPIERSIDIDTWQDFKIAECLLDMKKERIGD